MQQVSAGSVCTAVHAAFHLVHTSCNSRLPTNHAHAHIFRVANQAHAPGRYNSLWSIARTGRCGLRQLEGTLGLINYSIQRSHKATKSGTTDMDTRAVCANNKSNGRKHSCCWQQLGCQLLRQHKVHFTDNVCRLTMILFLQQGPLVPGTSWTCQHSRWRTCSLNQSQTTSLDNITSLTQSPTQSHQKSASLNQPVLQTPNDLYPELRPRCWTPSYLIH